MSWAEDEGYDGYWPKFSTTTGSFRDVKWETKTGERIALKDMKDSHLFNVLKFAYDTEMRDCVLKEMTYRLFEERVKNGKEKHI